MVSCLGEATLVLFYILTGVLVLTALSLIGVYIERQQNRRFEQEELAHLLARSSSSSNGKSTEPVQVRPVSFVDTSRLSAHLGVNKNGSVSWQPLAMPTLTF